MSQAGIKTYAAGTNSFPQNSSGSQNRDSPSPKKKQKPKRIKWTREEYKQVMSDFYQALNEPKNNNTKCIYEIWRKEVGEHRPYIDANKLVNVRRDIMKD